MNTVIKKNKLEDDIRKLINEFEESTGAVVEEVHCDKIVVFRTEWQLYQRMTQTVKVKVTV